MSDHGEQKARALPAPEPAPPDLEILKPRVPPGEAPWGGPDRFEKALAALPDLLARLHDLLCDEDLDEDKLQAASEGLLPNLADALTLLVPRMKLVNRRTRSSIPVRAAPESSAEGAE
jgi:hypothetical protein